MADESAPHARNWVTRLAQIAVALTTVVAGTLVVATPAHAGVPAKCSKLTGSKLIAPNGLYLYDSAELGFGGYCEIDNSRLYMQLDGNFVLYNISPSQVMWAANTVSKGRTATIKNGNLIVRNSSGVPVWSSLTCCNPAQLRIRPTPHIDIIRDSDGATVWTRP